MNIAKDLLEVGIYKNETELMNDALRHLIINHPEFKIKIAVYRYANSDISISKAARIAGLTYIDMVEVLKDQGINIRLGCDDANELQLDIENTLEMIKNDNI